MSDGHRRFIGPSGRQLIKVALLILAIVALRLAGDDPKQEQQPAGHESAGAQQLSPDRSIGSAPDAPEPSEKERYPGTVVGPGTLPDWAIVGFTFFLALLGYLQYRLDVRTAQETRDSLEIAKRTAEASQRTAEAAVRANELNRELFLEQFRPRVSHTRLVVKWAFVDSEGLVNVGMAATCKNIGNATANNVFACVKILGWDDPFDFARLIEDVKRQGEVEIRNRALINISIDPGEVTDIDDFKCTFKMMPQKNLSADSHFGTWGAVVFFYQYSIPPVVKFTSVSFSLTYRGNSENLFKLGASLEPSDFEVRRTPIAHFAV